MKNKDTGFLKKIRVRDLESLKVTDRDPTNWQRSFCFCQLGEFTHHALKLHTISFCLGTGVQEKSGRDALRGLE
jgi:hypothetical protein